jgi:hypothetical protein
MFTARWLLVIGLCTQLLGCSNPKHSTLESTFIPNISAGISSTCVTFSDAKLMCYGKDVGNASAPSSNLTPVQANIGLVKFFALSNSNPFGCAIAGVPDPTNAAGTVWCWTDHGNPASAGVSNAISVSVGGPGACAVLSDHSVTCWALTSASPIITAVDPKYFPPQPGGTIILPTPVTQVSVGGHFACALSASGPQVYCWGRNDMGQLGRGTVSTSPNDEFDGNVPVSSLSAKEIAAGIQHACAIGIDNTVQCWGSTTDGELGNGPSTQPFFATPQMALGINNALHITASETFTCATLTDHTAKCWGDNLGPIPDASTLGIGRLVSSSAGAPVIKPFFLDHPLPVRGLGTNGVVYISAGAAHACASGRGAAIYCWGLNEFGELTYGKKENSLVAVSP